MSKRIAKKTIETMTFNVNVIKSDIDGGIACDQNHCMHKVAITRALAAQLDCEPAGLGVKVHGGQIYFKYDGYRWIVAPLPRRVKNSLLNYDNPKRRHLVKPMTYTLVAEKNTKIIPLTKETRDKVREMREARIKAGEPSRPYGSSLRKRIVGLV